MFYDIVGKKKYVSLRIIDWLVTNYSKDHVIVYPLFDVEGNVEELFNMHEDYTIHLKKYRKKEFDPFRRGNKEIYAPTSNSELKLNTSSCQRRFFKWALEKKVVDYAIANVKNIEMDMTQALESRKSSQREEEGNENEWNPKKKELYKKKGIHICVQLNADTIVSFDD